MVGLDIEPELIAALEDRARSAGLQRVSGVVRDVASTGIGELDATVDIVLLFNLLHCEEPLGLLVEARRVLRAGGRVGIIHWRSDIVTPRGPDLTIRPQPETVEKWLMQDGFVVAIPSRTLKPYHYGLVGQKR